VAFLNALSANDRAALVDAKGIVNSEGVRRAILATFVATFKGEVGLRLAQAQFEELDNDVKVALAGIAGSLGFSRSGGETWHSRTRGNPASPSVKTWR